MPQPALPNMGLIFPTPGSDPNTWGAILNTAGGLIDAHGHTPGQGVPITPPAIRWNADLAATFSGTAYALTLAKAVSFTPTASAAIASYASALFANASDANNLYFRNSAGQLVRISNGPTLDLSAAGGFTGDYATVGADARFVDVDDAYYMRQQLGGGVNQYARVRDGDLDLYEYKAHPAGGAPTTRVRLASPAALGASYTLTMPTAQPAAAGTLLQFGAPVATVSQASFSNTNLAAMSLASGAHLTLQGGGEYKHGQRTIKLSVFGGNPENAAGATVINTVVIANTGGARWYMPIPGLIVGDRITGIEWYYRRQGGATITFDLRKKTTSTGADSSQSSTTVNTGTTYTVALLSPNYTIVSTESPYLRWQAGGANDELHEVIITYDHP
jgi:hypothetical protein